MSTSPSETPPPEAPPSERGGRRRAIVSVGLPVAAAIVVVAGYLWLRQSGGETPRPATDYVIVVPAGTGSRMDAGEQPALIPAELDLALGQRLVIRNEDDRMHLVGPFAVRAGEELVHQFRERGTFIGECTLHPDGAVTIRVT